MVASALVVSIVPGAFGAAATDKGATDAGIVDVNLATQSLLADDIHTLTTLAEAQPSRYGGVYSNGPTAVTICDTGSGPNASIDAEVAKLRTDGATVAVTSCSFTIAQLNSVLAAVSTSQLFADNGVSLNRWGLNYGNDSVDVGVSSIPPGFADKVANTFGPAISLFVQGVAGATGRLDDNQPYWGGDRITNGSGCTSGFSAHTSSGGWYSITAGHCWTLNTPVYVNGNTSKGYGTVSHRSFGNNSVDAELINGKTYASDIWNGGVTTTSDLAVQGSGYSCQGCQINFDGSFSGQTLGTVQQANTFCATIKSPEFGNYTACGLREVKSSGGTLCQGGDSGGPVFAYNGPGGATAVGIITGQYSNSDCLYTQVPDILSRWSLSIP
ncbi:hypothetical protein Back2_23000 [Nocardioides baekrokdamisoli]|uniref:Peptidase S1 domain-containing protein n=1 Tax=Nocardioides baekrokdamisoli TaxID=1804624 RepID=A0A3G9J071_9ACTN|nr:hypothetical protein Back2_23000 [Nocardioides baekrokdamisoli]